MAGHPASGAVGSGRWRAAGLAAAWLMVLTACEPVPDRYLVKETGRATMDAVRAELGPPDYKKDLPDGGAEWIYAVKWSTATFMTYASHDAEVCYEYTLTFDRAQVLRQWVRKDSC
jgi:hypothetical protein